MLYILFLMAIVILVFSYIAIMMFPNTIAIMLLFLNVLLIFFFIKTLRVYLAMNNKVKEIVENGKIFNATVLDAYPVQKTFEFEGLKPYQIGGLIEVKVSIFENNEEKNLTVLTYSTNLNAFKVGKEIEVAILNDETAVIPQKR